MTKAIWNGAVLAESSATIVIEGNHYFPPDAVKQEYLQPSAQHTVCGWKGTAIPHGGLTMASLSEEQVARFRREGYLLVENLLDPAEDLDPIIAEYTGVLDRLASDLYTRGAITSTYRELPFGQRLVEIYRASGNVHAQYFDFSLPQAGISEDTPLWVGPAVFNTLRNE